MPWNGSGSFTLNQDFPADRDAGSPSNIIDADKVDDEFRNIKAGLEATLNRNGENAATANISMGGNKLVSVGDATNAQDAMNQQTADARYLLESNNLSDLVNAATARTNLGVEIGADVQAYDAGLASIAGLTTAADRMIYTTAVDTYAVATLTSFARTLLDDADAATARATLGLGTIATQAANSVNIDGGAIDGTAIGASTASTGAFTTLTASGGGTGSVVINAEDSSLCPTMTFTRNGGGTSANNFLQFANSGGEVAAVNSAGQAWFSSLGVGTASPLEAAHVQAADPSLRLQTTAGVSAANVPLGGIEFWGTKVSNTSRGAYIVAARGAGSWSSSSANFAPTDLDFYVQDGTTTDVTDPATATPALTLDAGTGLTGGTGSAGAGNQYVELTIRGQRYKLLHDGTV